MSVNPDVKSRPKTTVILAMTADGKIADSQKTSARFGSDADKAHLEAQIALVDGVIFGAGTLRAYGSSLPITNPNLLQQRQECIKPLQPIHIVVSASGNLNYQDRFFQQPIPRWLLSTEQGAIPWRDHQGFVKVIIGELLSSSNSFDWRAILPRFKQLGIDKLAVLGGGELVASLFSLDLIDELWLTVCPIILGGKNAPTPVEGMGFRQSQGRKLKLLEVKQIAQEIFLHYQIVRPFNSFKL